MTAKIFDTTKFREESYLDCVSREVTDDHHGAIGLGIDVIIDNYFIITISDILTSRIRMSINNKSCIL